MADTLAIATMLVRPGDSAAALRVLGGPAVGLGLADLNALAARAKNLRARERGEDAEQLQLIGDDPLSRYTAQVDDAVQRAAEINARAERSAGLGDAVADLGEPERYSAEGYRRLQILAAKLRWLRTNSLGKRLPDLFADIITVFGIRTEVLARPSAARATHLDRLLEEVATYPGASLEGLLDYFELARTFEDGLAPGNVVVKDDRVQLLTAHKAKGLEWDTVAVLHADASTYSAKAETFLTWVKYLQDESFGDPDLFPGFADAETRAQFEKAAKVWLGSVKEELAEESSRLFYVAVTRAAKNLMVTASRSEAGKSKDTAPYSHFAAMKEQVGDECIVAWVDEAVEADDAHTVDGERRGTWPKLEPDADKVTAADMVARARATMPAPPGEASPHLFTQWENDVTALIEEHESLLQEGVPVVVPAELTASDVVAMRADPAQFARRARRPVPFKPNTFAKRGTAFHEWLEELYGARPLLDENELPGHDEADVDRAVLEQLKASFEASHWAKRTPAYVERPFELALGDAVVRGRIDAIFEDADGWTVVDWKTGQKPRPADMEAAKLQLAVYREAWRRIIGDGREVRAMFFYVRTGEDYAPVDLPDADELATLITPDMSEVWSKVSSGEQGGRNLSDGFEER